MPITITIKYNSKEYKATIGIDDEDEAAGNVETDEVAKQNLTTLGELRSWIANETGCDLASMKLIWKGNERRDYSEIN
jgi:hypothetical protein